MSETISVLNVLEPTWAGHDFCRRERCEAGSTLGNQNRAIRVDSLDDRDMSVCSVCGPCRHSLSGRDHHDGADVRRVIDQVSQAPRSACPCTTVAHVRAHGKPKLRASQIGPQRALLRGVCSRSDACPASAVPIAICRRRTAASWNRIAHAACA